ncbi:TonB-dependent siderophore receptor [Paucibacter sp. KBW04]|uniref:TonB-dependent receptor plug domain-containing protein n=1 Tax=Paucibacter sp. KBW04 TaxID=2153361 RepID=UPI001E4A72D4|nr:TonB-dependent receptor [Paucibacter sp. KBW04]
MTSLSRVEVTGSRLKRIDAEGPAPVNVYTRADLDRSGQPTLERFISSLNEASMSPGEGGLGQTNGQGSVQLRGLPLGSTLVLINGRRVQAVGASSGNFFNLNLIPMAAVERIEIVPVGSSAVYGGDALAGVVNIILKKSMEGVSLDARVGAGSGVGDGSVSLATGGRGEAGSFLLMGSYSKASPLTMADREFFLDADYRRFGGVDARTRSCTPGTVSSTTSAALPGLNASFAAISLNPSGQALKISDFTASAGQVNLCNSMANGHGMALIHGSENLALHAAGERHLNAAWSVFGELSLAKDRLHAEQSGYLMNNVLVPASNPYNPFGVAVRVSGRLGLVNGAEGLERHTNFTRVLLGTRGELTKGWELEASVSTTRDDGESRLSGGFPNVAARTAALAASTPAKALNPFTTGVAASEEVLNAIWPDSMRDNHGVKDQVGAFVRGSLIEMPSGSLELIAGMEAARDRYETSNRPSFDIAASRTSSAVFGEARVPLFRSSGAGPLSRELAVLTVAARRDRYSDFGSASTYQAGLEFRPIRSALLRGSVATSFKPPTLLQANAGETKLSTEAFGLIDPARANAPILGGEVLRVTNPELKPEEGRAYALGLVLEPESFAGTRFGVNLWRVKINGLISVLWPQVALDNEALFPGFVTRAPSSNGSPGLVTRVLYSEVNFGGVDSSGADLEVQHSWKAANAKWTLGASATRTSRHEVVLSPGVPAEDRLGRRATDYWSPSWKGRVFLGVDYAAWTFGATSRYLGAYLDTLPSQRRLGDSWVHDLSASLNLKRLGLGLPAIKSASLSLAVANVGDRMPEYVGTSPYYDVSQADWRGRYANVRLSVNW